MSSPFGAPGEPAGIRPADPADESELTRIDRVLGWDGMIWLYAAGLFVPCALFSWRYPLPGHTGRLHDLGGLSGYGTAEYLGFIAGMAAMFACYALAILHCRARPAPRWRTAVVATAGACGLAMARMYPVNAIDLFIYAVRSRLWTAYGKNPIAVTPAAIPRDPWVGLAGEWRTSVSPYGPLWNWVAAPGTWLGGDRIGVALAYEKALAFVCFVAIGLVVLRLDGASGHPGSAVIWLWNPLVLWEGVGNGHNDLAMMLPVVLAIWAVRARRPRWVVPLLTAAFAIKYVALLVVPLAVLVLWKGSRSVRAALGLALWSAAGAAVVLAFSLAPFFDLHAIRESVRAQNAIMLTSPASWLLAFFRTRPHPDEIAHRIRTAGTVLFLVVAAIQVGLTWRRPERWVRAMFEVLLAYLLIAAWTFRSWYLIWLVALAALLPVSLATWRVFAWTASVMAAYALYIWIWHWWGADYDTIQNIAVPLMFGPALALTLWELARTARAAMPGASGGPSPPAPLP